jgi:hypothetical protein
VNWILKDATRGTREVVRDFAIEHRLIDVILGMADLPPAEEDALFLAGIPAGSLLAKNVADLADLGVKFSTPQLWMEKRDLRWTMDEFRQKVGGIAPTLLLVEMPNGTECGGVAGVPWPPAFADAKDPSNISCLFSLGATPARFDLVSANNLAICSHPVGFWFGSCSSGSELGVLSNADGCVAIGGRCYAAPQGYGSLIGTSPVDRRPYARWELWRL